MFCKIIYCNHRRFLCKQIPSLLLAPLQFPRYTNKKEFPGENARVHVEAEITKGHYNPYDTFLGKEAVDFIKTYLDIRRQDSPSGHIPPETIHDQSPLIRDRKLEEPKRIRSKGIN